MKIGIIVCQLAAVLDRARTRAPSSSSDDANDVIGPLCSHHLMIVSRGRGNRLTLKHSRSNLISADGFRVSLVRRRPFSLTLLLNTFNIQHEHDRDFER